MHIQRELVQRLVEIRTRPYYIYQCDLVEGAGHFRTPVGKGLEIIEGLRGHTSGYAVPQFIVDAPGGGGKIPVMPNYLVSYSDHKVVLRNYEGYITTYEEPTDYTPHDKAQLPVLPEPAPRAGPGRHHGPARRQADVDRAVGLRAGPHARHGRDAPPQGPRQVGAVRRRGDRGPGDRRRATQLPVLEAGVAASEANGASGVEPKRVYGPGEEPRPAEGKPTATANHELL